MVHIQRNPDLDSAFQAMSEGFQDYIIPFNLTREKFEARFLGQDGNALEHSVVAYDHERPVALWLNGVKMVDGMRTMRCGGLAVVPEYRKQGIATSLYEAQLAYAKALQVKKLQLEVIQGNMPAIQLYERLGYQAFREIGYFSIQPTSNESHQFTSLEASLFFEQYQRLVPRPIWQQDQHVMEWVNAEYYEHELGFVAVKQGVVYAVLAAKNDIAQLATVAASTLEGEQFHMQSTEVDVWADLIQAGWTQGSIKQFEMELLL
ncbi:GNAT family N-acetyltransferase [Paenibacillus sp. 1001270B_150601_E10]|uniref:GNAT family N-acetyltransferase n=1 Tax=Paenibacillus sp. 1001270B_150601_E10 TaxID=2787079 RepID=UPI00189E6D2B|nr:GNAT family N-acetyltransferase [Paenibacillus sp. 1001270B_150601_E10]